MATDVQESPKPQGANQAFQILMERVRDGSQDAAWELIEMYGHHILRAVRRMLHEKMRSKFDSTDFVQAVWASFFTSRDQLLQFDRPEKLVSFLAKVARNKVGMEYRRRLCSCKHDVRREIPLAETMAPAAQSVVKRQATPSQIAVARERWRRVLADQPEVYRRIVYLRYSGETYDQIAEKVGMNERSVRKILDRLFQE